MKNIVVNVTLPAEVVNYIDEKAQKLYISRSTVARQLVMEHVEEEKVVHLRKKGFSIRKIAELTSIRYDRVLRIIGQTGVDEEEDAELEQYMDDVQRSVTKKR
ncbi:MAG TPA: hypothetical protein VJH24_05665 [Candidatus Bilamarchaeaceae archaeon]|nr:hypothetical protein [Candidatus Bilamarchaeaceae archaeon]